MATMEKVHCLRLVQWNSDEDFGVDTAGLVTFLRKKGLFDRVKWWIQLRSSRSLLKPSRRNGIVGGS